MPEVDQSRSISRRPMQGSRQCYPCRFRLAIEQPAFGQVRVANEFEVTP